MKWLIPAKTFFLGEYVAIAGGPAIVLTTTPCFELTLTDKPGLNGIHSDSPAGRFWSACGHAQHGLTWHDPYLGRGGLGASSAQFLGAYRAHHTLQNMPAFDDDLLSSYFHASWTGEGVRPSGYDVLAQSSTGCVYIHRKQVLCHAYTWPFKDLAFILLHTGQKLATHKHLQALAMPASISPLIDLVERAKAAFDLTNSSEVIDCVNAYHQELSQMGLVAPHSVEYIKVLQQHADILAVKGCGAMGADLLLVVVEATHLASCASYFATKGLDIIATSENLYMDCK